MSGEPEAAHLVKSRQRACAVPTRSASIPHVHRTPQLASDSKTCPTTSARGARSRTRSTHSSPWRSQHLAVRDIARLMSKEHGDAAGRIRRAFERTRRIAPPAPACRARRPSNQRLKTHGADKCEHSGINRLSAMATAGSRCSGVPRVMHSSETSGRHRRGNA